MNYINNKKIHKKKQHNGCFFHYYTVQNCANLMLDLLTIRHTVPALRADEIFVPL